MLARTALLSALAVSALTVGTAIAQEASPAETTAAPEAAVQAEASATDTGAAYESARNQLGVLTYCEDKGFIDSRAVATQNRLLGMIPQGDAAKGDAAETLGKTGTVSAMGVERTLADAASEQKTTEDALCKQMDALLQQLAAQVPS
ncbi:pore-forming ESAT-6 family protein [Paracoccus sp. MBLB3053]|uniref:Pore-forming ESAT-6 family protein n=1 Tax=Paracoccus aurantius TaxID=3073814 RepID=A0ABU2HTJ9_9RHOB|nr:pore-forming ESAT-6 family protein [Paracoccus sp. MBLB3053]MDS9468376.1 pore-forming ESAT-6 family protein [Paracoccus sp. MBLB3053]